MTCNLNSFSVFNVAKSATTSATSHNSDQPRETVVTYNNGKIETLTKFFHSPDQTHRYTTPSQSTNLEGAQITFENGSKFTLKRILNPFVASPLYIYSKPNHQSSCASQANSQAAINHQANCQSTIAPSSQSATTNPFKTAKTYASSSPLFTNPSQQQERINNRKKRVLSCLHTIGKGLLEIKKQGYRGKVVDSSYLLQEVVSKQLPGNFYEKSMLKRIWEEEETSLSFIDWRDAKLREYQNSNKNVDFTCWLKRKAFFLRETSIWLKEAPNLPFPTWHKTQLVPSFYRPLWLLKEMYNKEIQESQENYSFEEWKENILIPEYEEISSKILENYGLELSTQKIDQKLFEYEELSGFPGSFDLWLLTDLWKLQGRLGNLEDYIDNLIYQQKFLRKETRCSTLKDWQEKHENFLQEKHKASNLPIPYEVYKKTQISEFLFMAPPFVQLDPNERKAYQTTCENGVLKRNDCVFDTSHEETLAQGEGYAIFVIGPNKDLYCGSHVANIFHHSSFLSDGAITAAGEIQTDSSGEIVEITSRSGHYKPGEDENRYLLHYFQDRGVDLSKVAFIPYDESGEKMNLVKADEYLQYLETGLSKVNDGLFL